MFFYASKVFWFFATPSNLLATLVLAGLALALLPRTRRLGWTIAGGFTLALLVAGLSPLSSLLILPLEERFPPFRDDGGAVHGIVLLGGAVEADDSEALGQVSVNEAADRVLATIRLARRYPEARIVISGGSGSLLGRGAAEAPLTARYFEEIGIEPSRILAEDRSRTTAENAAVARALVAPKPGERWLLVTSAWHMPRSVGVFRQAGFPVTAYPVDRRTAGRGHVLRPFAFVSEGLRRLDVAAKEWAGLVGYRLSGRTPEIFPGPCDPDCQGDQSGPVAGASASAIR
jgi:uncharacterized SAM-binding protein YcdF (DUF218 family)